MEITKTIKTFLFLLWICLTGSYGLDQEAVEAVKQKAVTLLQNQSGDYFWRKIERVGDKTVRFEAYISFEAEQDSFISILSDFKNLPNWITRKINQRPGGGEYYSQIDSFSMDDKDPGLAHFIFSMKLPGFTQTIARDFRVKTDQTGGIFMITGKTEPKETALISEAQGILMVIPQKVQPGKLWLYSLSNVKIRSRLLYEALPDKLLNREAGERIFLVLDNYRAEEDKQRKLAKSNQTPK